MSTATDQFTENPQLTAIAIAYSNPDHSLIADQVLPRVPVGSETFSYVEYDEAEGYTVPDTKVGRRSSPNQVEISGKQKEASVEDHGIDVPLDSRTIAEASKNGFNPENRAAERATNIVILGREIRTAGIIGDASNYHEDHVTALSGSDLFSDVDSDPLTTIEEMMASCWMTPNQLVFGYEPYQAIRKNPNILKAIRGNLGDQGRATRKQLEELFEVKRILVGTSRFNIKLPGEKTVLARAWGNFVAGHFIDSTADTTGGVTFGFTAQYGTKVAGTLPANMGLRGGKLVRSGESVSEHVIAKHAGFLISNAA